MGVASTIYDVRVNYFTGGTQQAGREVESLGMKADAAAHKVDGLGSTLKGLAATLGAVTLLHKAKEAFIDFNSEMESMSISMTALTQANLGESFEKAHEQTQMLITDFTSFAKQSPLTTKEVVNFAQGVEAGVFAANGNLQDFKIIAEQGSLAAKMLGADANYAGTEIQEMLQGSVRKNMRFARNLMGFVGMHDTNEFNSKSDSERLALVKKALQSQAMQDAGKSFTNSFSGVTSTFVDNLQLGLGKIGLPLFKQITAEVQRWNQWIEKHPKEIEEFATRFSGALISGFNMIKGIGSFFVENADTLMTLAKVWIGAKLIGAGASSIGGGITAMLAPGRSLAAQFTALNAPVAGFASGIAASARALPALLNGFSQVAGVLALVYTAASAFADWVDSRHDKQIEKETDAAPFIQYANTFAAHQEKVDKAKTAYGMASGDPALHRMVLEATSRERDKDIFSVLMKAHDFGMFSVARGANGNVSATSNTDGAAGTLEAMRRLESDGFSAKDAAIAVAAANKAFELAQGDWQFDWSRFDHSTRKAPSVDDGKTKKNDTYVHIDKVEVLSDDPDKFVHGMIDAFDVVSRNPVQARRALKGI